MTLVYFTVDTEYEPGFTARRGPGSRAANFARSIRGENRDEPVGIEWQMDRLGAHGLKAVFFVDPLPALLWGVESVADIVGPIVERGHDVQLHLHTEWLAIAGSANPLDGRTGTNIADFGFEDQCALLDLGRSLLQSAGAPRPIAFRAGNYGANDDTLRALAAIGMTHDSSHAPGIPDSACRIGLGPQDLLPVRRHGVVEVPIGCIDSLGKGMRHAQLTALSSRELHAAIRHARDNALSGFTIVSHSFELLSRDRRRTNRIVKRRFEKLCAWIERTRGVTTGTYADNPPRPAGEDAEAPLLPANPVAATLRVAEQAVSNALYGG